MEVYVYECVCGWKNNFYIYFPIPKLRIRKVKFLFINNVHKPGFAWGLFSGDNNALKNI